MAYAGSTNPLDGIGGSLGAKIDISANRIPTVMARLDSLTSGIVQTVNAIHTTGQVFNGIRRPQRRRAISSTSRFRPPPAAIRC